VILLYERDPDLAQLWSFLLEHLGYAVEAVDQLDAARLSARTAPVDLAVVRLDDAATAYQACQQIRGTIGAPVIALLPDASADLGDGVHILALPVAPRALRALVQMLVTGPLT
jgi:DNA-binding response OmpR family regulator